MSIMVEPSKDGNPFKLKVRNETLEQVSSKYDDISVSLNRVMDEKEAMIESYNNEIKKHASNYPEILGGVLLGS